MKRLRKLVICFVCIVCLVPSITTSSYANNLTEETIRELSKDISELSSLIHVKMSYGESFPYVYHFISPTDNILAGRRISEGVISDVIIGYVIGKITKIKNKCEGKGLKLKGFSLNLEVSPSATLNFEFD